MTTHFWSDPHLGLNRTSHTTPVSRKALRDALYHQAKDIVAGDRDSTASICLGDLFDTTENDESVIAQGAEIASKCALVLSGNHDLANRDGRMSSLALIGTLCDDSAIAIDDDSVNHFRLSFPDCYIVTVPHKRTQGLFDEALAGLENNCSKDRPCVLLLHCNYASGFATAESSLNLTREQAAILVEKFDYVLLGHEHIPRSDFDGRLQILGNIHPTSFADISDKFIWRLEEGVLVSEQVWSTNRLAVKDWEWLLNPSVSYGPVDYAVTKVNWEGIQFIDITGTAPAARLPEIAKAIQKLWSEAPDALMIRNSVKAESVVVEAQEVRRALDIPSRITEELQGSKLLPLWTHYLGRV